MPKRTRLLAGSVAIALAGALPAADGDWEERLHAGWLELGAGYQDGRVTGFNRSDGFVREGFRGTGAFRFDARPGPDPDADPVRWFVDGRRHPAFGASHLDVVYGVDGRHRTEFQFEETRTREADGLSPFRGAGGDQLRLPDDWVPATTTGDMDRLEDSLVRAPYSATRQMLRLAHQRRLDERWQTQAEFRVREHEGTRPAAAVTGATGGNVRAALVPAPVNYTTREADLELRYQEGRFHAFAGYRLSLFSNDDDRMEWDDPWSRVSGWSEGTGHPDGRGHLGLAPDNAFHLLHGGISRRFSETLRLSADAAAGQMRQDEPLQPYTVNPSLQVDEPLPRESAEGRVDILRLNTRLNWRPAGPWRVDARYRGEDRNDRTPRDVFNYVPGDALDQTAGRAHGRARINRPYSFTRHRLDVDAALRRDSGGRWFAGYGFDRHERDLAEVGYTAENRVHAGFRRPLGDAMEVEVRGEKARRRVDDYDPTRPYRETHTAEYIDNVDEDLRFENHPLLRRFNLADRDRWRATTRWSWQPVETLQLGATLTATEDTYPGAEMGLVSSRTTSLGTDLAWFPSRDFSLDLFASHDRYRSRQNNRAFRGAIFKAQEAFDSARDWDMDSRDRVQVYGTGGTWRPGEGDGELTARVVRARTDSRYDLRTGPALSSEPVPSVATRTHSLEIGWSQPMSERIDISIDAYHERFNADDWAWQDVAADTMATVIASGQSLDRQRMTWLGASLRWHLGPR